MNVSESWHITSTKYNSEWRCVLWDLENKKVNKQTVILKGIHATPEGEKVISEYEKEGVQNGVYRVLKSNIDIAPKTGIEISEEDVNPILKPHQRDAVIWAVRGGRRALFESFGLGKTVQALEWCNIITRKEGEQALIVLPLGVKQEFKRDAVELLGLDEPQYVRNMNEVQAATSRIVLTN